MDYMVDPDGLSFNSIEDEVVLDNDKPESHTGEFFSSGILPIKGYAEIPDKLFSIFSLTTSAL